MEERGSYNQTTDGVFSRPYLPDITRLPRERLNRQMSGPPDARIRIKSERDLIPAEAVKIEPFLYPSHKLEDPAMFQHPSAVGGSPVIPPRRRDSLPDHYLSYRENRREEFDSAHPLNLSERKRNYSDGEGAMEGVKEEGAGYGGAPEGVVTPMPGGANVFSERSEVNSSRTVIGNLVVVVVYYSSTVDK